MITSLTRRNAAIAGSVIAVLGALAACGSSSPAQPISSASVQCVANEACSSGAVTLGNTTLTVASDASQSSQTVFAQLVTDQKLHCPSFVPAGGAVAIFSSTAPDAAKTVTYTITGTVGQAVATAHRAHPQYMACFGSPLPFGGYTGPRTNNRAVFVPGDGLYEAQLLQCGSVDTKPCFSYEESGDTITLTIEAPPGDPKMVP